MNDEQPKVRAWTHFYWDIFANTCWPFDEDVVTCGRTEGQFQYEDGELSGAHCQFTIQDGKCFISDLDSKNGTYLNLKEIEKSTPLPLKCFDVVIFGRQIIVYMDENIFKLKTREDLLECIQQNIENEDVFSEIKNKTLLFMKNHHPRLIIRKKIQVVEKKIADAYNIKEDKLSKYDDKANEIKGIIGQHEEKIKQHQGKISQLEEKIQYVMGEKDKMAAKIDPQIDALHAQVEKFNDEIEAINDRTTA